MIRRGKGRKDCMLPIGERVLGWIGKYLADVRPAFVMEPDGAALFITGYGEPLSANRLSDLARNYVNEAAIGKQGAYHLFRHTMATLMLENGADIRPQAQRNPNRHPSFGHPAAQQTKHTSIKGMPSAIAFCRIVASSANQSLF